MVDKDVRNIAAVERVQQISEKEPMALRVCVSFVSITSFPNL